MTFIHTRPTFIPIHCRLEILRTMKNKRGRRLQIYENIIFQHGDMVCHSIIKSSDLLFLTLMKTFFVQCIRVCC